MPNKKIEKIFYYEIINKDRDFPANTIQKEFGMIFVKKEK